MTYQLLTAFTQLFQGVKYRHRSSSQGDKVAAYLYEDLFQLGRSKKFVSAVQSQSRVLNRKNLAVGKSARRGDGTFGESLPHIIAVAVPDQAVAVGDVATIEIGAEVKILAKAMRKQLDRVCTDLSNQVTEFKKHGGNPICVGIVGINYSDSYTSYEGAKKWTTGGTGYPHPIQEAGPVEKDLLQRVLGRFDELIILRFKAINRRPFVFSWVDQAETENVYGAALVRISREYESRF